MSIRQLHHWFSAGCIAAATDDIEQTLAASNSGLQYDAASQQHLYVWKTATSYKGSCRRLTIAKDGTQHTALFQFK